MRILVLLMAFFLCALPARAEVALFADPPLVKAVKQGDIDALKRAITGQTGNVNGVISGGRTLLMQAALDARADILKVLLAARANPNLSDDLGNTALMYAVTGGDEDGVETLLKAGAKVNQANRQGLTPLMAAAKAGLHDKVKLLLAAGADTRGSDYSGRTALDWAQESRDAGTLRLLSAAK